jgi:hypothetical protein
MPPTPESKIPIIKESAFVKKSKIGQTPVQADIYTRKQSGQQAGIG